MPGPITITAGQADRLRQLFAVVAPYAKSASDAVLRALTEVIAINRKMPDDELSLLRYRSPWPDFMLSTQERIALAEELAKTRGPHTHGDLDEEMRSSGGATPQEVMTLEDVMALFRSCCVGRTEIVARDWHILNLYAMRRNSKFPLSARDVGRRMRVSHQTVLDRVNLQCGAIARAMGNLIGYGA